MIFSLQFNLAQPNIITLNQIQNIAKKFNAKILQENSTYSFYLENPDAQILQDFGHSLSVELSNSIFIKNVHASYVDSIENSSNINITNEISAPCKECLSALKEGILSNNCEICNSKIDINSLTLKVYEKLFFYKDSNKEFFEKFAQLIANGGIVQSNNDICYFNTSKDNFSKHEDRVFICKDLNAVCTYFSANEHELKMLACVEKPIINLNTKEIFVLESKLPIGAANVRLANNQIEVLLLHALEKLGINIFCFSNEKSDSKIELHSSQFYTSQKVAFSKNSQQFYVYKTCKNLDLQNTIVLSLSKEAQSSIYINLNNQKSKLISFDFSFKSFTEIFKYIENMDEKGKSLIDNFKTKMPQKYEQLLKSKIKNQKDNLADALLFINLLISDQKYLNIYENAHNYKGTSGGKLDFRVDSSSNASLIWTIRTVISYLLAGASSNSIAYAVFESLADFCTQVVEINKKTYQVQSVIFAGSMFEEKVLFQKSHELISKNNIVEGIFK